MLAGECGPRRGAQNRARGAVPYRRGALQEHSAHPWSNSQNSCGFGSLPPRTLELREGTTTARRTARYKIQERWYLYGDGWERGTWMGRLAVAEEGLVVDPRLQALEVEPARGLGRQRPARRTGRRFALVLVRPVALVAVAALAFAIFRAGVAVGILVATVVIAIERHLVEARVVIGIPSRGRSICNKRG